MAHGGSGDVCHSPPSLPAPTPQEPWRKLRGMLTGTGSRVNFSFCERPRVATRLAVDSVFLAALHAFGSRWTRRCCCWRMACAWAMARPLGGLFCGFERSVGADAWRPSYVRIFDHRASARSPVPAVACRLSLCNPAACLSTDGSRHREGARPSPASCIVHATTSTSRDASAITSRRVAIPLLCAEALPPTRTLTTAHLIYRTELSPYPYAIPPDGSL
jgi:hypothetical protein